jgi:hypothetical protein
MIPPVATKITLCSRAILMRDPYIGSERFQPQPMQASPPDHAPAS